MCDELFADTSINLHRVEASLYGQVLLFRKQSRLNEDGHPWLRGAEEPSWTARHNISGKGVASTILFAVHST